MSSQTQRGAGAVRRFKFGKFGLRENPIGHHVAMPFKGRTLLGEVVGVERDELRGQTLLEVRHFCGDYWPLNPPVLLVEVLE